MNRRNTVHSGKLAMVYFLTMVLVTWVFVFIIYLNPADMFYILLYISDFFDVFFQKIYRKKIHEVKILTRSQLLGMKNLFFLSRNQEVSFIIKTRGKKGLLKLYIPHNQVITVNLSFARYFTLYIKIVLIFFWETERK